MGVKDISLKVGDTILVKFEREMWKAGGQYKETVVKQETGTVVAKPSQKFDQDGFDIDYSLGEDKAVKSIDFDNEKVAQLLYDAGGDRDWDSWDLCAVERI